MDNCIFCKIAKKEIPSKIVHEDDSFFAFLDIKPIVNGHTLIIPKRHFVNFLDMPSSLGSEMSDFIKRIAEIRINEGAEGFNLLMRNGKAAGQDVFHAHIHLIPRKSGDGISSLSV